MPYHGTVILVIFFTYVVIPETECCHCPHIWEPICATDSQLYSNMCFFMCARNTQPGLMTQDASACNPADPNAAAAAGEGEGGFIHGFLGLPAAPSPTFEPDPTFNSVYGLLPSCSWNCRKAPAFMHNKICDDVGETHTSECEFYKAVCRAEMGGYLLRRGPCRRSRPLQSNRRRTWVK